MDMKVDVPQVVTKQELQIALLENNKSLLAEFGNHHQNINRKQ